MDIHWCIKKFQKKVIRKTSEIYSKNKKKIILFNKNSFTVFYLFFISKEKRKQQMNNFIKNRIVAWN